VVQAREEPSPAEVRRLGQFFTFNIPVNYLIAVIMLALWLIFHFWSLLVIGILVVANIAALYWARGQLSRGRVQASALGIAAGVIVQVLAGMYLSGGVVLPLLALLTLWPVVIALPYLGKTALLWLMVSSTACGAILGLLSLAGDRVGLSQAVPSWVWMSVDAFCIPVFTGFLCQFVWHYSSNLQDALSRLRSANIALQSSERELEHKIAERTQELAEKNQQLMKLDEMKTRFVSNASHELRSPLTAIRAFSELLAEDPSLDGRQAEFARIINSETERLAHLASDLLDLNRIEEGALQSRPRSVDVRSELELLMSSQQPLARRKGLTLRLDAPPDLPDVCTDPDGLRRVLLNLIQNALKFTERGAIVIAAAPDGNHVRIAVSDTGVGISPTDQPHVFERFYQAGNLLTEKPAGAGLGLAICHEILALQGAELQLESILGQGSTFSFKLPAVQEPRGSFTPSLVRTRGQGQEDEGG
jgi:signal transduction histidine kinase